MMKGKQEGGKTWECGGIEGGLDEPSQLLLVRHPICLCIKCYVVIVMHLWCAISYNH